MSSVTSSPSFLSAKPQTQPDHVARPARYRSHLAVYAATMVTQKQLKFMPQRTKMLYKKSKLSQALETLESLAILSLHFSLLLLLHLHFTVSTSLPFKYLFFPPHHPLTHLTADFLPFLPLHTAFLLPHSALLLSYLPTSQFFQCLLFFIFFSHRSPMLDCKHKAHNCSPWPSDFLVIAITILAGLLMSPHSSLCPRSLQIQIKEGT